VLRALFCHHRCGSTWLGGLLEEVCEHTGYRFARVFDAAAVGGQLARFVEQQQVEVLLCMNSAVRDLAGLGEFRAVHVVRDPRDVVVSSYYSHRYSHPADHWLELAQHREELAQMSLHDGLLAEIQCRAGQFSDMQNWDYSRHEILELRFETLVESPAAQLAELLGHLGLLDDLAQGRQGKAATGGLRGRFASFGRRFGSPSLQRRLLSSSELQAMLSRHSFEMLSGGRNRGDRDDRHHYRSGMPGQWRDELEPEHLELLELRFSALLARYAVDAGAGPGSS
tara:strand:+ start:1307 stop:2152 length:846 start_codon:yes stop_codon:yes gene_type:complete